MVVTTIREEEEEENAQKGQKKSDLDTIEQLASVRMGKQESTLKVEALTSTENFPPATTINNTKSEPDDLKQYDSGARRRSSIMQRAGDFTRRISRNIESTHASIMGKNSREPDYDNCSLVAYFEKKNNEKRPDKDVDGGYALVILAVMFIMTASTFGTARAYGLIFEKSVRDDSSVSRMQAAIPFTIMGALENMSGPLAGYILTKFQSWRLTVIMGSILVTLAHFLAGLFDSVTGRIITMGFICGFGTSLITISSFQINNAYFDKYRSRAFGFGLTGAAFGTLYISPLCRYVLDSYSTNACFFLLGLIILPNIGLALLLRPKLEPFINSPSISKRPSIYSLTSTPSRTLVKDARESSKNSFPSISGDLQNCINLESRKVRVRYLIKRVLTEPIFHLIWPTQLIFCWLNFVIGMIVVDYARDRHLNESEISYLIPLWALGQLIGRLVLGAVVDMKIATYKTFTVVCLSSIALSLWALGNVRLPIVGEGTSVVVLVLILSIFIANLYILFNGLVASYIDRELTAMSIGISSFISGIFLLPRAHVMGYYRDTFGNYNSMLDMFTYVTAGSALIWLFVPSVIGYVRAYMERRSNKLQTTIQSNPWLLIPNTKLDCNENKSKIDDSDNNNSTDKTLGNNNIMIVITETTGSKIEAVGPF